MFPFGVEHIDGHEGQVPLKTHDATGHADEFVVRCMQTTYRWHVASDKGLSPFNFECSKEVCVGRRGLYQSRCIHSGAELNAEIVRPNV